MPPATENDPRISSRDIPTGRFSAHGEIRIWIEGDVICYEATGPFNLEALQALAVARLKIMEQWHPVRRVAAIVHWKNSALMSPEAFEAYRKGLTSFHQHRRNPVALAWVAAPEVEGMSLMVQNFQPVFESVGTNFRLFQTVEPARAWIEENLVRANQQPKP
jgi:hypothetical protein